MRYKRITLSTVSRMKMPQPAMSEGAMKSFLPRWRWTITFLVAVKLTKDKEDVGVTCRRQSRCGRCRRRRWCTGRGRTPSRPGNKGTERVRG